MKQLKENIIIYFSGGAFFFQAWHSDSNPEYRSFQIIGV